MLAKSKCMVFSLSVSLAVFKEIDGKSGIKRVKTSSLRFFVYHFTFL